jgi:hypothetical protein
MKTKAYRTIGRTYDVVDVLAPKTKSKNFTREEIQSAFNREHAKIQCGICGKTPCDGHGHNFIPVGEI